MSNRPALEAWLRRIESLDLAGLADMYHPDAVVEWLRERWEGRDEIQGALATHGRQLRKFRLDGVRALVESDTVLSFETQVQGPFGRRAVRHDWAFDGDGIHHHTARLA